MGPHCTGTPPGPVPGRGTSLYENTSSALALFPLAPDMGPHSSGTPAMALPDMFKLLHYEACMVDKRTVRILLESFLVISYSH